MTKMKLTARLTEAEAAIDSRRVGGTNSPGPARATRRGCPSSTSRSHARPLMRAGGAFVAPTMLGEVLGSYRLLYRARPLHLEGIAGVPLRRVHLNRPIQTVP